MLANLRRAMSLRISLVTAFSTLILLTAFAIVSYTDASQRRSTLDLSEQLITQVSETVIQQTTRYLSPAMASAELVSTYVKQHPNLASEQSGLMVFMAGVLRTHPQIQSVYVGDVNGSMYQVRRETLQQDDDVETEIFVRRWIDRNEYPVIENLLQVALEGDVTYGERVGLTEYDPRVRPWYTGATEAGRSVWTDTYIFYSAQQPGLTAAVPVYGNDGELIAVAGTDITMGVISSFLSDQKIGESGMALILNDVDQVVAHPEPKIFQGKDGELKLPTLDGLGITWWSDALAAHADSGADAFQYSSGELEYLARFISFPESLGKHWRLALAVPVDDFLWRTSQIRWHSLMISVLVLLVAILLSSVLARRVSRPIIALAEKVERIEGFHLDNDFDQNSFIREVQVMSHALGTMQAGLRSFSHFVPAALVRQLVSAGEEARLGGQERRITVLFSDLKGYSTLIEHMPPQDVLGMLNEYLGGMQEVIEAHDGTVLEYIGDAILVVFGAPADLEGHAEFAVRCALAMQERLHELNAHWVESGTAKVWQDQGVDRLTARIGVHTGDAIAGNVGTKTAMKYGVVGDAVNVAARLEQLNKQLGTEVLISEETWAELPEDLSAFGEDAGVFELKGRGQSQRAYRFGWARGET